MGRAVVPLEGFMGPRGVVESILAWDGHSYGFGNAVGVCHELPGGLALWGVYAHLDGVDVTEGQPVAAGELLGTCGRSGFQRWSHLHLELRWRPFSEVWLGFWGGRLDSAELFRLYADPFTLFRLASGWNAVSDGAAAPAVDGSVLAALEADRDYNYGLKMAFEGRLQDLEERRRLKRGTTDRLVASVPR